MTVSFLLDKTCPRHARAGLRRRALPVADAARRGWRSGQNMAKYRHILGTARGVAKQLQVRLYLLDNLVGITFVFVLRRFYLLSHIDKITAHGFFRTPLFHFHTVFCSLCATQSTQSVWYIIKKASITIQIRL